MRISSGKSRVLCDWFINLGRQQKITYSFDDGKGRRIIQRCAYLDLPNVGRTKEEIFDYIKDVENLMTEDFTVQIQRQTDFPSGWWICCITTSWDKKEFNEIKW